MILNALKKAKERMMLKISLSEKCKDILDEYLVSIGRTKINVDFFEVRK